jgi:hypothetical protein
MSFPHSIEQETDYHALYLVIPFSNLIKEGSEIYIVHS